MSLHFARRKLLFSVQNIHNFEKLLCQQGAVVTQESCYHSLNVNQTRGKKRERGKWRGYSEGGAGTAPPSWKNAAFGAVALSAGAAIGKFYFQKIFFEKVINHSGGFKISRRSTNPWVLDKNLLFPANEVCVCVCVCVCLHLGEGMSVWPLPMMHWTSLYGPQPQPPSTDLWWSGRETC